MRLARRQKRKVTEYPLRLCADGGMNLERKQRMSCSEMNNVSQLMKKTQKLMKIKFTVTVERVKVRDGLPNMSMYLHL